MPISFNTANIAFTGKERSQKQKDAEKKVVTGGGAIAATTSAAKLKSTKSGFDMFASAGKVSKGMSTVTNTAKTAQKVAKQSTSLWSKVCKNARWAKDAVLNWGTKFKNMRLIKPLVKSPVFKGIAGALGYGFGAITLIAGLADITKVTSDAIENLEK